MKAMRLFFAFSCFLASLVVSGQERKCDPIDVKIEVVQVSGAPALDIDISGEGNFKIRIIDTKGNVREVKKGRVTNLPKGDFDLIVVDETNDNRCPFSKRIRL